MATPRIATYHRVSTLDQNPALARAELRAAAKRQGRLVLEVEEKGSGARNDRPGLQRLLAEARKGGVDAVLVWKLDRFGRSTVDLLTNIMELQSLRVRFLATSQGLDIHPDGGALGKMMLTMLAAVAEFERSLISERTILGIKAARKAGRPIGRPPSISPLVAAQVKRLRAAGRSWSETARAVGCTVASARRAAAR